MNLELLSADVQLLEVPRKQLQQRMPIRLELYRVVEDSAHARLHSSHVI